MCIVHEDWVVHVCSVIFVLFIHHKLLIPIPQLRAVLGLSLVRGRLTGNWVTVNMINTFFLTCIHSSFDWESWVRRIIHSLSLQLIWVRRIHLMPITSSFVSEVWGRFCNIPGTYFIWLNPYSNIQRDSILPVLRVKEWGLERSSHQLVKVPLLASYFWTPSSTH